MKKKLKNKQSIFEKLKIKNTFKKYKEKYLRLGTIQTIYFFIILILSISLLTYASYKVNKLIYDDQIVPLNIQNSILNGETLTPEEEALFMEIGGSLNSVMNNLIIATSLFIFSIIIIKSYKDSFIWKELTKNNINWKQRLKLIFLMTIITGFSLYLIGSLSKFSNINLITILFLLILYLYSFVSISIPLIFYKKEKKINWKKILKEISWKKILNLFFGFVVLTISLIILSLFLFFIIGLISKISIIFATILVFILLFLVYILSQNLFFIWQIEVVRQK